MTITTKMTPDQMIRYLMIEREYALHLQASDEPSAADFLMKRALKRVAHDEVEGVDGILPLISYYSTDPLNPCRLESEALVVEILSTPVSS